MPPPQARTPSPRTAPSPTTSDHSPKATAPFQAMAVSPTGGRMMNSDTRAATTATIRPHGRARKKMPNTTPTCCARPAKRSVASDVPKALKMPASTHRLPGP